MNVLKYLPESDLLNVLKSKSQISFDCFYLIDRLKFEKDEFGNYAFNNQLISLIKLIKNHNKNLNWNLGLYHACQGGHRKIVDLMIQKGADKWNFALTAACNYGHHEIIDLMIQNGADNLNRGLWYACLGGQREIIKLMIQKGATACYYCGRSNTNHLNN